MNSMKSVAITMTDDVYFIGVSSYALDTRRALGEGNQSDGGSVHDS